ncbi:hypothetical protein LBMAG46_24660 [Planctomycetia bacterium]|nr:hypothetical protein LBMAG46_24660 [Planctomycetia bacterium]
MSVAMCQHGPEAAHGGGIDSQAELGQVAFEERADERFTPGGAVGITVGKEGAWEATAKPERFKGCRSGFGQVEAVQINKLNASGEGF